MPVKIKYPSNLFGLKEGFYAGEPAIPAPIVSQVKKGIISKASAYHASAETNREKYKEEISVLITALTEALKKGNTTLITKADTELNAKLTTYKEELNNLVLVIHDKKDEIDEALKPHKDSKEYQKILASSDDLTNQKLTFDKKYQNIKSLDNKDKKKILSLYICNFVVILILVLGCALVFMEKKLPISKFLPKKMRNNKNNSRNNNANNN